VQRARDRLRINAQLIDARTGRSRWAETLRSTASDLFAIQSELAEIDRRSAEGEAFAEQKAEIEERPTQDLDRSSFTFRQSIIDSYLNATDVGRHCFRRCIARRRDQTRPEFVSAYCYAARAISALLFSTSIQPRTAFCLPGCRKGSATASADSAEAHFAWPTISSGV